jgi:hypothetical protein
LNVTNHGRLQLDGDIVASLEVLSDLMMTQDNLLRMGSVIGITMAKGGIPRMNAISMRRT